MPSPARTLRLALIAVGASALLMGVSPVQSNDAFNRNVRVHNQTGWPMTHLQVSSGGNWGGDLLGTGTLSPGASMVVRMDDGSGACRYALRAQFDNGQTLQRDGVNACQVADYYFTR
ncbi:hypothetical protein ACETK8_02305 [Brevundimonas staleyi]|uniref:Uncharacterized protein n=1 Tax=Brevundimonas staleyi TaxID=74326 RepID=A0ABW0FTT2_9CAUL